MHNSGALPPVHELFERLPYFQTIFRFHKEMFDAPCALILQENEAYSSGIVSLPLHSRRGKTQLW
jgi:hypothetical protein